MNAAGIHQLNCMYSPEEDRILMRMNTTNGAEFRFALTRRFVRILWPALMKLLSREFVEREPAKAHVAKHVVAFEHEKAVKSADLRQPYAEDAAVMPLGEEFLVLTKITIKQAGNQNMLCFFPKDGKGIEFGVNAPFIHVFCNLLQQTLDKAQWDLNLWPERNPAKEVTQISREHLH